jgi:hypothetical protein
VTGSLRGPPKKPRRPESSSGGHWCVVAVWRWVATWYCWGVGAHSVVRPSAGPVSPGKAWSRTCRVRAERALVPPIVCGPRPRAFGRRSAPTGSAADSVGPPPRYPAAVSPDRTCRIARNACSCAVCSSPWRYRASCLRDMHSECVPRPGRCHRPVMACISSS